METAHDCLATLDDEVTIARASTISSNSRASYLSSTVRFLQWMLKNKRGLVNESFASAVVLGVNGLATKESVKSALSTAPTNPPIDFERITARDFMTWIVSMKNSDDTYHSFSTYAGHRSAFYNLFQDYHCVMSTTLTRELSSHFKGFQRQIAAAIGQGLGQIKVGKDPMPLSLYKQVAMAMLMSPSRDMVFARTFMVLSWNLMSRAANTASICYRHLEWREDALCVYFAHMKNDQRGCRPRDPRHVYSNPTSPEICPILALGVYWVAYGIDSTDVHLFPGSDQYERFRKVLVRVLKLPTIAAELERRGMNTNEIGTHSMRKGASTFCSSGSTACPPAVAVHLRAGWSMGGVQDRYLRHDAAGDMFVGRTVSGLPILEPEFAVLPPHFTSNSDAVQRAKRLCFAGLPESVEFVAEFALASLIYHLDFLQSKLNGNHPLFQSPLFADVELVTALRSLVKSSGEECEMQPTGVPPHVTILTEIRAARNEIRAEVLARKEDLKRITDSQDAICSRLVAGVSELLEERAFQAGVPTCNSLADSVMKRLEDGGVLNIFRSGIGNVPSTTDNDDGLDTEPESESIELTPAAATNYPVYHGGGSMHLFPEGMVLPRGSVEQAWVHWCCGDRAKNLPAFRQLRPVDLSNRNERKRLCELKFLMKKIEQRAQMLSLVTTNLSFVEAADVFQQCKDVIELPLETVNSRKRRRGQLVWVSAATILRKKAKGPQTTMAL